MHTFHITLLFLDYQANNSGLTRNTPQGQCAQSEHPVTDSARSPEGESWQPRRRKLRGPEGEAEGQSAVSTEEGAVSTWRKEVFGVAEHELNEG